MESLLNTRLDSFQTLMDDRQTITNNAIFVLQKQMASITVQSASSTSPSSSSSLVPETPPPPTVNAPVSSSVPWRRLTDAEVQDRHSKGLCFKCDEKFHVGHRCKSKQFFLLMPDDDNLDPDPISPFVPLENTPPNPCPPSPDHFYLSLGTMMGDFNPRTLRLMGHIHGQLVTVLVDPGFS
ncbi:hypothetical protein SESBI_38486 [Sesbania bispinosa]|nr:hypothetical protein SESBI_38486 [Sesbania bispinosa]